MALWSADPALALPTVETVHVASPICLAWNEVHGLRLCLRKCSANRRSLWRKGIAQ